MPGGKSAGPSIKDKPKYERLKKQGYSKERAAKIANGQAGTKHESNQSQGAKKGGKKASKKTSSKKK